MFENLTLATLENPIVLAFIIAILRVVLGFLGNKLRDKSVGFDAAKFGETLVWYETFLVVLSQSPFLREQGLDIAIAAILDVIRTASKLLAKE